MRSSRLRVGVALVLDPPVSDEVDGLRRALGDPSLARIAPHVTLVPPVNIHREQLQAALTRLRHAASAVKGPLWLTLGPTKTFMPENPVLYLDVGGDLPQLRRLRDSAFAPPLERALSWQWVPHVTIFDSAPEPVIDAALTALGSYAAVAEIDRLVLLEETKGRIWRPLADANLGPRKVVGTGGLALELTPGRILDPEAKAMLEAAGGEPGDCELEGSEPHGWSFDLVMTARREGEVVGAAAAWRGGEGRRVGVLVVPAVRGQGIGRHLLAHLESYSNSTAE